MDILQFGGGDTLKLETIWDRKNHKTVKAP